MELLVFDVNETLSDMSPMGARFEDVGVPGEVAAAWFATLLRDGFALAVAGEQAPFSEIGADVLRTVLTGRELTTSLDDAVEHVLAGLQELDVHDDVPDGVRALRGLGLRLVTLSNGSSAIAERLLARGDVADGFERLLSVEEAGVWKPSARAYEYAVSSCGVERAAAMLVAVHPWDIDGASRAGLASAWINRGSAPYPGHFRPPDVEAASLVELAERLGA
ncbi:haloacid dehalogenase type II [Nocardioides sp. YIM 152315]|uniref:haloacid dehalogenase type II n=1 Tax=Nocardioides sp. YIM 152315 TaxID=3031760 RepID=UPI0023DB92FE|nr:haloacid dehalogenase type II [Nocardioides sp. YIM 152315]MDF1603505.1 haloacid dehalogenase type II [Nocardioides sp. YIM 152315]